MIYNSTTGAWLNVDDNLDGKKITFVNECVQTQSDKFKNDDGTPKMGNLVKVQVEGESEVVNMRPNWTSIGAVRDAFGPDSKDWIGKTFTAKVKDATTGQSVYLLPDGFELYRNEEKRWAIRRAAKVVENKYPENNLGKSSFDKDVEEAFKNTGREDQSQDIT